MSFMLLSIGGLAIVLIARAYYHHESLRRDWEFITSAWCLDAYENYAIKAASEEAIVTSTFRRANSAQSREEAQRILDVGLKLVESRVDDWISLLHAIGLLSRMADAVTPISPLVPWAFRSPAVGGLALIGAMAHYVLVTTGERLRLRAYVLRGCWRLTRRRLRSGRRLEDATRDLAMCRTETLHSFRDALLSSGAQPTAAALTAPRQG